MKKHLINLYIHSLNFILEEAIPLKKTKNYYEIKKEEKI